MTGKKKKLFSRITALMVMVCIYMCIFMLIYSRTTVHSLAVKRTEKTHLSNRTFQILWYNPPVFIKTHRKHAMSGGFDQCRYSNCDMIFGTSHANRSQAIIFDGIHMPKNLSFTRPVGQIWIFAAHESPFSYSVFRNWYENKAYSFNWTMTYNKDNTDIFLPYGDILKRKLKVNRDFKSVALHKNKTVLIIVSHCKTPSRRHEFVKELQRYVDVDIFGHCGKKFYENFNYDIIMLVRGGSPNEAKTKFPKGTYLATEGFKSIRALGTFLKNLSVNRYAEMLKRKNQYYSPGYLNVYQKALCEICERMNNQARYQKTIENIKEWAFGRNQCFEPDDI